MAETNDVATPPPPDHGAASGTTSASGATGGKDNNASNRGNGGNGADRTPEEIKLAVIEAIKEVYDPEIPINVYELGLIYGVEVNDEGEVYIEMTLTTPNCPAAGSLPGQVQYKARAVPGVQRADVDITFSPPWSPERMSEAAKLELGFL